MELVITILLVLALSLVLERLGRKVGVPSVVSLIITGLIFGTGFFRENLIEPNISIIFLLGNIGLFILMFLAGMETSWKMLKKEERDSAYIASFGFVVPFILGFSVFMLLGFSVLVSLIVGLSMSITAEATKARVLLDIKKLRTKVGSAMMGAGIIDDALGLLVFFVISLAHNLKNTDIFFTLGIIAAFFGGIFVQSLLDEKKVSSVKKILFLFVPFFFISMGVHFDFGSLVLNPFLLVLIVILAFAGKMLGVLLTKPFINFSFRKLFLIGWSMNSRGAIELAFALLAFKSGIISVELYSALVIMALVTTLVFPFVITKMIKKNPKIMD